MGCWSVFFAEVVSFSYPFPLTTGWGLMAVMPVYTLHLVLLATLVFSRGRATLAGLLAAGAMLGLYEAYLTKVLWSPTWCPQWAWKVGGISVPHTAVLVLFWHPLMAFIAPLMAGEQLLCPSRMTLRALPARLGRPRLGRWRPVWLFAAVASVLCGVYQSMNAPSIAQGMAANLTALGLIALGCAAWRAVWGARGWTLRDLLPGLPGVLASLFMLGLLFGWLGCTLRPQFVPRTWSPHMSVWGLYLIFFSLVLFNRPLDRIETGRPIPTLLTRSPRRWSPVLVCALALMASSAALTPVKAVSAVGIPLMWIAGITASIIVLGRSAWRLWRWSLAPVRHARLGASASQISALKR